MIPQLLIYILLFAGSISERETTHWAGRFIERTSISENQYLLSWGDDLLSWGDAYFKRSLPDTFYLGESDNPKFEWENVDYICLRAECGTNCWYSILLPLDPEEDYLFYIRPLAFDPMHNYVAFPGNSDTLVVIEHMPSGIRRCLITSDRCGGQENYICIKNVSFDPHNLVVSISWSASGDGSGRTSSTTDRVIEMSLIE
jgi:hypothetical protein